MDYEKIRIIRKLAAGSHDNAVKKLMAALDEHLESLNTEKTFNEDKLKEDVRNGNRLIGELSDKLSHR